MAVTHRRLFHIRGYDSHLVIVIIRILQRSGMLVPFQTNFFLHIIMNIDDPVCIKTGKLKNSFIFITIKLNYIGKLYGMIISANTDGQASSASYRSGTYPHDITSLRSFHRCLHSVFRPSGYTARPQGAAG